MAPSIWKIVVHDAAVQLRGIDGRACEEDWRGNVQGRIRVIVLTLYFYYKPRVVCA